MQSTLALGPVVAGDPKTIINTFARESQDWTGVVVACKLRTHSPVEAIVHTFTPIVEISDDVLVATLLLTGTESAALGPGEYFGDVVISIASTFGPYTPVQFRFTISPRITS